MAALAVPHFWIPKLVLPDWRKPINAMKGQFLIRQPLQFEDSVGQIGFGADAAAPDLSVTYLHSFAAEGVTNWDATTTGSVGAVPGAGETRWIIVHVGQEQRNATPPAISSVTVLGNAASAISGTNVSESSGASNIESEFYIVSVPTGTSGTFNVTFASNAETARIDSYRMISGDAHSGATHAVDTDAGTDTVSNTAVNVAAGGVVVAVHVSNSNKSHTWGGNIFSVGDEDFDESWSGGGAATGASIATASDLSAQTSTCTFSGSQDHLQIITSFAPDG